MKPVLVKRLVVPLPSEELVHEEVIHPLLQKYCLDYGCNLLRNISFCGLQMDIPRSQVSEVMIRSICALAIDPIAGENS